METKYDGYYEREIAYKMTLAELQEYARDHNGFITEEYILAYIRFRGADFRMMAPATSEKDITHTPFGFCLTSGREGLVPCKLILRDNNLFNPLMEDHDVCYKGHWYNPYKIEYTPENFQGCIEKMYFCDFCSLVQRGDIILL